MKKRAALGVVARDTFGFRCVRRMSPEELALVGESPSAPRSAGN